MRRHGCRQIQYSFEWTVRCGFLREVAARVGPPTSGSSWSLWTLSLQPCLGKLQRQLYNIEPAAMCATVFGVDSFPQAWLRRVCNATGFGSVGQHGQRDSDWLGHAWLTVTGS